MNGSCYIIEEIYLVLLNRLIPLPLVGCPFTGFIFGMLAISPVAVTVSNATVPSMPMSWLMPAPLMPPVPAL